MNAFFIMDPLHTVVVEKDTTYMLMKEAQRRGMNVAYVSQANIHLLEGDVHMDVTWVNVLEPCPFPFEEIRKESVSPVSGDIVFIRKDPPFDAHYLHTTWVLEHVRSGVLVLNNPHGIRTVNEKIWASQFTSLVPDTLITSSIAKIRSFLDHSSSIIIKPTNGYGGQSIFLVHQNDINKSVIFETVTHQETVPVIVQRYIPEASHGDKRILLVNGDPLGAILRAHSDSDHRNNFFAGGTAHPTELTSRDHEIIATLKPYLQELGLFLLALIVLEII